MQTTHPPGPGYRALRRGRVSLPHHGYLVTTVCLRRQPFFADWAVASAVSRKLADPSLWRSTLLQAWVLMPDHVHVLLELGDDESLGTLMRRVKAVTSRVAKTAGRAGSGATWMAGFHDHMIRDGINRQAAARYIVANPVRAGLAASCRDYPYWDAIWI